MRTYLLPRPWPFIGQRDREPNRRTGIRLALVLGLVSLLVGLAIGIAAPRWLGATTVSAVPVHASGELGAGWTRPQAGWLYVVDPNDMAGQAQVLLVDPVTGAVKDRVQTGQAPDIALAPDGARLYVASTDSAQGGVLDVIDTATGTVLQRVTIRYRTAYKVLPVWSRMAISPDGRWLYISQLRVVGLDQGPAGDEYSVAVFDTQAGQLLADTALIPGCSTPRLIPTGQTGQVVAFCHTTSSLHFLQVSQVGPATTVNTVATVTLPTTTGSLVAATWLPGTSTLVLVTSDGQIVRVDGQTRQIQGTRALSLSQGQQVLIGDAAVLPNGTRLYLGLAPQGADAQPRAQQIMAVDTATWQPLRSVTTSRPFVGLTVSPDGRTLHAFDPDSATVLTIDMATYQERPMLTGIGMEPSFVVVAP